MVISACPYFQGITVLTLTKHFFERERKRALSGLCRFPSLSERLRSKARPRTRCPGRAKHCREDSDSEADRFCQDCRFDLPDGAFQSFNQKIKAVTLVSRPSAKFHFFQMNVQFNVFIDSIMYLLYSIL